MHWLRVCLGESGAWFEKRTNGQVLLDVDLEAVGHQLMLTVYKRSLNAQTIKDELPITEEQPWLQAIVFPPDEAVILRKVD